LVDLILPEEEGKEAKRRLLVLQECGQEKWLNRRSLDCAFKSVAESYRPTEPGVNANALVCSLILKSARAGFAASTVALSDPVLSECVAGLGTPLGGAFPCTLEKAFVAAPWRAFEDGLTGAPRHPLLRLTRELYPEKTLEGNTVLTFLELQLKQFGVRSEEECPTGELDLLDLVAAGLAYGRRLKTERPELVANIITECAGKRLEDSKTVVQQVVTQAGQIEPVCLIRPLLKWYLKYHHDGDPSLYGHRLARVGCLGDFAVWIPWLAEK
jgi:hypothetical protein